MYVLFAIQCLVLAHLGCLGKRCQVGLSLVAVSCAECWLGVRFALSHKCRSCDSGSVNGGRRTEPRRRSTTEGRRRTTSLRHRPHRQTHQPQPLTTALRPSSRTRTATRRIKLRLTTERTLRALTTPSLLLKTLHQSRSVSANCDCSVIYTLYTKLFRLASPPLLSEHITIASTSPIKGKTERSNNLEN